MSFEQWWETLVYLANEREFELNVHCPDEYREYYEDGDTPEDALLQEMGW